MIKAYAKSDKGKVREINQDYFYISNSLDEVQLYILADGMGGYNGGEIASSLAVQTAKNYIENNFKEIEKDRDSIIQLLGSSMEYANMVVYEKSKENPELQGEFDWYNSEEGKEHKAKFNIEYINDRYYW